MKVLFAMAMKREKGMPRRMSQITVEEILSAVAPKLISLKELVGFEGGEMNLVSNRGF